MYKVERGQQHPTYFAGKLYQKRIEGGNTTAEQAYFNGAQAVAMRKNGTLYWLVGDHQPLALRSRGASQASTSLTASADGTLYSEIRYSAYGEVRFDNGTTPTKFQYTGQLSQMDEIGLYYYVARWYDPVIAHFTQADTLVPNPTSSKHFDRYAYSLNNPIVYNDPSGHDAGRAANGELRDENYYHYAYSCNTYTFLPYLPIIKPLRQSVTLLHAGSQGRGDLKSEGPEPRFSVPVWVPGSIPIRYPGTENP